MLFCALCFAVALVEVFERPLNRYQWVGNAIPLVLLDSLDLATQDIEPGSSRHTLRVNNTFTPGERRSGAAVDLKLRILVVYRGYGSDERSQHVEVRGNEHYLPPFLLLGVPSYRDEFLERIDLSFTPQKLVLDTLEGVPGNAQMIPQVFDRILIPAVAKPVSAFLRR